LVSWARGTPAGYFEENRVVTSNITLTSADSTEEFDGTAATEVKSGAVIVID